MGHALTWEKGRQLKSFDNITYTYNANGIRTSKTVNGVKHTYTLDGTKILRETWGDSVLIPLYDNEDSVCGIVYNDVPYYFLKNLQGDIIAITDYYGSVLARYRYEAWGTCAIVADSSEIDIATINPFRYRGYYYDTESGMYYLQSRYYNPEIGRFLNGDDATILAVSGHIASHNYYSYCNNNIVNHTDSEGRFVISTTVLCVIGGALLLGAIGGIGGYHVAKKCKAESKDIWKYVVAGLGIGVALGALAGYFLAPAIAAATGVSGISITKAGVVALPPKLAGQGHHVISNKIIKAIQANPSLRGTVDRAKSIVKAWSKNAHKGYQTWHRDIDDAVVKWLAKHPNATTKQFGEFLYNQYCTKDMIKRFGEDVLNYIKAVFF